MIRRESGGGIGCADDEGDWCVKALFYCTMLFQDSLVVRE